MHPRPHGSSTKCLLRDGRELLICGLFNCPARVNWHFVAMFQRETMGYTRINVEALESDPPPARLLQTPPFLQVPSIAALDPKP